MASPSIGLRPVEKKNLYEHIKTICNYYDFIFGQFWVLKFYGQIGQDFLYPVAETFGDYISKFSQFGDYISKFGQIW